MTVCVSSQVGCAMGCSFCATGLMGFQQNLTSGEIAEQVQLADQAALEIYDATVSNVVFMGMGEPLLNMEGVLGAIDKLTAEDGFGLGAKRITVSTVGPALMEYGSDEQKAEFLPKILQGECHFSIGYSEPNAGTDLANLSTTAVADGDDFIINGTKMFTSGATDTDYIWLAARTDPDAPRHKGITMFIVPANSEGFSAAPIHTLSGSATAMTYYENVRVPKESIVGGLNGGWKLITSQLNHERVGLAAFGSAAYARTEKVIDWAKETDTPDGQKVIDLSWVQSNLAEVYARIEAMKLLNWRMTSQLESGFVNPADASAVKVYGTEGVLEVYRLLQEIVGPSALVYGSSPAAQIDGEIEHEARVATINTFGGGVNEIQREIVSMAGLRMPRVPR